MSFPMERRYTVEEYFAVEETSSVKHEFYQGHILAMAGASLRHNRITGNVYTALRLALAGSACEAFASDLRVRTPGGLYTYPDVMVVCGGVRLSQDDRLDTVVNPAAIVEILSESTAAYDRGEKFRLYRAVPTLREYLLIEHSIPLVEHLWREGSEPKDEWLKDEYTSASTQVRLHSLAVELTFRAIYDGVEFPAHPD